VKAHVVAVEMGYGHVRAAASLASVFETEVILADSPSIADASERRLWAQARGFYEGLSRLSQFPFAGPLLQGLLEAITAIPHLHPYRDLSKPTSGARYLARLIRKGLGKGLAEHVKRAGLPLVTTFYSTAIAAEYHGCERVYCVVTDGDVNRIWAPLEAGRTKIRYLAPAARAARRLRSYGIPAAQIALTGFPLPGELLGGQGLSFLQRCLARRLVRLDPEKAFRAGYGDELHHFLGPLPQGEEGQPPLMTLAIGGAGAQVELAKTLVQSLRPSILERRLRLALVAGVRKEVASKLEAHLLASGLFQELGGGVQIVLEADMPSYLARFNQLLSETDILWTKPSELTFYGALGLPLVLAPPIGVHERYNRRWARESGAGLKQRDPRYANGWLGEWLADGTLAGAAWSGFTRLPKFGSHRILETVTSTATSTLACGRRSV
jgi:hypothetical protein